MVAVEEFAAKPERELCDVCGREIPCAGLLFCDSTKEFLCEACRSEEESCGCSDD